MRRFFGKYRGKVVANKDPFNLGRIQVNVPAIFGEERNSWAMPCTPYAGKDVGFFAIPPLQANVWIEFEAGDPDYPIWSGCFWGMDELPQLAKVEDPVKLQLFRTQGLTLTISQIEDANKGVNLLIESPIVDRKLKLKLNKDGIEINNGDELTAKLKADVIEIKNKDSSVITIASDSIQIKESSIEIKLTNTSIELNSNPASLKLTTSSGIELANAPSSAKLTSSGIELTSTPAVIKAGASGIELNSGGLGNIKLSLASTNVNSGALEVT